MFDTNAFDYLLDHRIDPVRVRLAADVFITNVQHVELLDVPDRKRRKRLIGVLSALDPVVRPAQADVWPEALRPDERYRRWSNPATMPDDPHPPIRLLRDGKDRAIAEVAQQEGCVVVTDDRRFRQALEAVGLEASSCAGALARFLA